MTEAFEVQVAHAAARLLGLSMEEAYSTSPPPPENAQWLCATIIAAMVAQQRYPEWGLAVTRQYEALVRVDFDSLAAAFVRSLPVAAVY